MILPAMPAFYQQPKTIRRSRGLHGREGSQRARASSTSSIPTWTGRLTRAGLPSAHARRTPARIAGMFDAIARALRPPQPPAERRHRSALAHAGHPVAAAHGPRARARPLHRHGAIWRWAAARRAAAAAARHRRGLRRRDAPDRARQGRAGPAWPAPVAWCAATRRALPAGRRVGGCGRRSPSASATWQDPRPPAARSARAAAGRPPRYPRVRAPAAPGRARAVSVVIPARPAAHRPARLAPFVGLRVSAGIGRQLSPAG